ncbi:hypothetical protein [Streptomyces sp. PA5.6]|uniref:hypothetical protein n=1 Tax=Streptomyces sp. PA5.6 TaxID=3035651 RepID=UPI003904B2E5
MGRTAAGRRVRAPAEAGYAVVGELMDKLAADGTPYGVLLMERPLGQEGPGGHGG